jgi:hypothetical protein
MKTPHSPVASEAVHKEEGLDIFNRVRTAAHRVRRPPNTPIFEPQPCSVRHDGMRHCFERISLSIDTANQSRARCKIVTVLFCKCVLRRLLWVHSIQLRKIVRHPFEFFYVQSKYPLKNIPKNRLRIRLCPRGLCLSVCSLFALHFYTTCCSNIPNKTRRRCVSGSTQLFPHNVVCCVCVCLTIPLCCFRFPLC